MQAPLTHYSSPRFWENYDRLPSSVQRLADDSYESLKKNPRHPSLYFEPIGRFWSVRVGLHYRALRVSVPDGVLWFWIGTHAEYDRLLG